MVWKNVVMEKIGNFIFLIIFSGIAFKFGNSTEDFNIKLFLFAIGLAFAILAYFSHLVQNMRINKILFSTSFGIIIYGVFRHPLKPNFDFEIWDGMFVVIGLVWVYLYSKFSDDIFKFINKRLDK